MIDLARETITSTSTRDREFRLHTLTLELPRNDDDGRDQIDMKLKERIEQVGATGYILLWLLGIPIPILILFFLLRGCT